MEKKLPTIEKVKTIRFEIYWYIKNNNFKSGQKVPTMETTGKIDRSSQLQNILKGKTIKNAKNYMRKHKKRI